LHNLQYDEGGNHMAETEKILKKNQITPPPKIFPVLIKFDTAHIFIPPAILR
jgi:hypothetical protein